MNSSPRAWLAALIMAAVASIPLPLRSADTALETAALAWDAGEYVTALTTYLQILDGANAETALETIALQTGELYSNLELTADGAAPTFSLDGRFLTFETGPSAARKTVVARIEAPTQPIATLSGYGAAFSPEGSQLVYLKLETSEAIQQAQAAVDTAPASERTQRNAALAQQIALESTIVVRDIASGRETTLSAPEMRKTAVTFTSSGVLFAGSVAGQSGPPQIHSIAAGAAPKALTSGDGEKQFVETSRSGAVVAYSVRTGGGRGQAANPRPFGVIQAASGTAATVMATALALSSDGNTVAFTTRDGQEYRLVTAPTSDLSKASQVRKGAERLDAPALSRDGSRIAFQMMPKEDWELFLVGRDGKDEKRVTREIQHDVLPRFLEDGRLLAAIGEARHRRSYQYDLATGVRRRVFHNNSVRTIAPEYAWVPSPDGRRLLIVADRDGDTVSPERGVYLIDFTRRVTRDTLRARLRANLAAEQALRAKARRLYAPIAADVKRVVDDASVARIFAYQKALFDFDSKHISRPGNKLAAEYLHAAYASFGYRPEYQSFAGRGALGGTTSNVLATLKGTVNPELVYVVSSHYDSVAVGPGADDDSSGTAALLETARILARHPQPATIIFASFTGEEGGLLGSREFVRQAVATKMQLVGALNNDMVGWTNDHRLDNTIRYSNPGIRDIQHAAAMQFSAMITYDALYYRSTDAAAYYEAYGDIVGGIGSYPVLGSPHYHQSHDTLDTINHQLVTEVAKTTAATLMLLASSPARLKDVQAAAAGAGTKVTWTPSPEKSVTGYIVAYGPPSDPEAQQVRVATPAATLPKAPSGTIVSVKAVNSKGLEGWDWARTIVTDRGR